MRVAWQRVSTKRSRFLVDWDRLGLVAVRHTKWILAGYIFLATMLIYPVRWDPDRHLAQSGLESLQLGSSLAFTGNYSDPFLPLSTGPSAHLAPGYPALVAVVIKLFGAGPTGYFALSWLTKIVLAFQLALLPFLADYLGLLPVTGAIAAGAWVVAHIPIILWENDLAGLIIVVLAFPMYKAFRIRLSKTEIVVTGLLWGILLLLTPVPLLVLWTWLLALLLFGPQLKRHLMVLAVIPVLVIVPWLVRNYLVFRQPIFLRDNLGLELAVSNNPCAQFSLELNQGLDGCFARNHPNESFIEALRVKAMGEPAYNKARLHEAFTWIHGNPSRFLALTAERFAAFWAPSVMDRSPGSADNYRPDWILDAFTVLSIPGLLLTWRKNRYAAVVLGLWLLCFPPAYYLIQFDARYRHPILWATLLPGAYLLTILISTATEKAIRGRNIAGEQ